MFIPQQQDLTIYKGSTFRAVFKVFQADGVTPYDLTGHTGRMQIREKIDAPTTISELTTENGGMVIATTKDGLGVVTGSSVTLYLSPVVTAAVTQKKGVYDLELVDSVGDVGRLLFGDVVYSPEVTR